MNYFSTSPPHWLKYDTQKTPFVLPYSVVLPAQNPKPKCNTAYCANHALETEGPTKWRFQNQYQIRYSHLSSDHCNSFQNPRFNKDWLSPFIAQLHNPLCWHKWGTCELQSVGKSE